MGFAPYVDALALVLTSDNTAQPFTVSLEGEWGSGKSSFIRQLKESIGALHDEKARGTPGSSPRRNTAGPRFVDFNAWQHDKDEALWASFALEFTRQVAAPLSWPTRIRKEFTLLFKRADKRALLARVGIVAFLCLAVVSTVVKHVFFPTLGGDAPTEWEKWITYLKVAIPVSVTGAFASIAIVALRHIVRAPLADLKRFIETPDYRAKLGFLERFHEDFAKCVKAYTGSWRTFVFVDDLDRCEVPKAVELLQALNLLLAGDLPLVVVLAMDRPKIAAGVATRNRELLPYLQPPAAAGTKSAADDRALGIAYGYEFVEKFVQLSLRIPRLSAETAPAFLDSLVFPAKVAGARTGEPPKAEPEDPVTSDGSEVRAMLDLVAPMLGFNPRRLKQFLNLFRVRYFIASKTGQLRSAQRTTGWTIQQLGKIVAIEIVRPRLLDELLAAPHSLAELHDLAHGVANCEDGSIGARCRYDQALMGLLRVHAVGEEANGGIREVGDLLSRLYGARAAPSNVRDNTLSK